MFLEVLRCSRAKERQRNEQKKCATRAKLLFCKLVVRFRCRRRLTLHDSIFCLNKLQILSSVLPLALGKSVY